MRVTKYVLPVVVGSMAAMMLIILGERYVQSIYPLAIGTDMYDADSLALGMKDMPAKAFALLMICYAICSFAGGIISTLLIKRESSRPALVVGIVLMFSGIYKVLYLPHPTWFVLSLLLYIPCSYLGYLLLRKRPAAV